jgi:hypothetical protein
MRSAVASGRVQLFFGAAEGAGSVVRGEFFEPMLSLEGMLRGVRQGRGG